MVIEAVSSQGKTIFIHKERRNAFRSKIAKSKLNSSNTEIVRKLPIEVKLAFQVVSNVQPGCAYLNTSHIRLNTSRKLKTEQKLIFGPIREFAFSLLLRFILPQ